MTAWSFYAFENITFSRETLLFKLFDNFEN